MDWRARHPQRWQLEQETLNATGWAWQVVADGSNGPVAVDVEVPVGAGIVRLRAIFPDSYPYFAPQVFAPPGTFVRHQNPVQGALCLLARHGEDWSPSADTLGNLIQQQFSEIQRVNQPGSSPEEVAAIEDHAAEPVSIYAPSIDGSVVLVPDETPPAHVLFGKLRLTKLQRTEEGGSPEAMRLLLQQVSDPGGAAIVRFEIQLPVRDSQVQGYWVRLQTRPEVGNPEDWGTRLVNEASRLNPGLMLALKNASHGKTFVVGIVYPDEVSWRHTADDWLFLAVHMSVQKKPRKITFRPHFLNADWAGPRTLAQRAPFLAHLKDKRALVIGLGSLGSPVVLQLARAGVGTLQILDSDVMEAGNAVRWAVGMEFVGLSKEKALAQRLKADYPYTKTLPERCRIGIDRDDDRRVREMITSADLVVDAAASHPLTAYLSDVCWELNRPFVWLTTTPGAKSGVVGRVVSSQYPCWGCYVRALGDGTIAMPPVADDREVQPGGCGQPTFIGAALDSDEIALLASRLAIATLCRGIEAGYPDMSWDVAVGDVFEGTVSQAPRWRTYPMSRHPACPRCSGQ